MDLAFKAQGGQRTSPLSVLLNLYYAFVLLVLFAAWNIYREVDLSDVKWAWEHVHQFVRLGWQLAGLLGVLVLFTLFYTWRWYWIGYRVGAGHFHYREGRFWVRERTLPYDRVQSVEVRQKFFARLLGLAELHIESAGGTDSNIDVAFIKVQLARDLQCELNQIVDRVKRQESALAAESMGSGRGDGLEAAASPVAEKNDAKERGGAGATTCAAVTPSVECERRSTSGTEEEQDFAPARESSAKESESAQVVPNSATEAGELSAASVSPASPRIKPLRPRRSVALPVAPPLEICKLNNARFALSCLLTSSVLWALAYLLISFTLWLGYTLATESPLWGSASNNFKVLLVGVAVAYGLVGRRLFTNWNASVRLEAGELRVKKGLFTVLTQHTQIERVHGVIVKQSLLWRICGWWRGRLVIARGLDTSEENTKRDNDLALPVGSLHDVECLAWSVLPALGTGSQAGDRQLFISALEGSGREPGWSVVKGNARLLTPFDGHRQGIYLTPAALIWRSGFFDRRAIFVPLSHVQSYELKRGPVSRLLGCATLEFHLVLGSSWSTCRVRFLEAAQAQRWAQELGVRIRANLRSLNLTRSATAYEILTSEGVSDLRATLETRQG